MVGSTDVNNVNEGNRVMIARTEEEMNISVFSAFTTHQAKGQLGHRDEQALSVPVGLTVPMQEGALHGGGGPSRPEQGSRPDPGRAGTAPPSSPCS